MRRRCGVDSLSPSPSVRLSVCLRVCVCVCVTDALCRTWHVIQTPQCARLRAYGSAHRHGRPPAAILRNAFTRPSVSLSADRVVSWCNEFLSTKRARSTSCSCRRYVHDAKWHWQPLQRHDRVRLDPACLHAATAATTGCGPTVDAFWPKTAKMRHCVPPVPGRANGCSTLE